MRWRGYIALYIAARATMDYRVAAALHIYPHLFCLEQGCCPPTDPDQGCGGFKDLLEDPEGYRG